MIERWQLQDAEIAKGREIARTNPIVSPRVLRERTQFDDGREGYADGDRVLILPDRRRGAVFCANEPNSRPRCPGASVRDSPGVVCPEHWGLLAEGSSTPATRCSSKRGRFCANEPNSMTVARVMPMTAGSPPSSLADQGPFSRERTQFRRRAVLRERTQFDRVAAAKKGSELTDLGSTDRRRPSRAPG